MPISFDVKPRHVRMFGAQGVLAPLYQRQATKLVLQEEERRSQSRFEQMKALTELRTRLEQPFQRAQIERLGVQTELGKLQLGQLREEDVATEDFAQRWVAAPTQQEKTAIVQQEFARRGMLQGLMPTGEQQQKERIWWNPETGRMERTTATGVDYGPAAIWKTGAGEGQPPPNIPMTGKDFAFEEDQIRQLVGGLGGEKLNSKVLSRLGIKQAGTLDNYINKFLGGEWNEGNMGEFAKIFAYMSDPANERIIRKDKQIQTLWGALRRAQRAYDPYYRDQFLRPQGAIPGTIQAGGEDRFGVTEDGGDIGGETPIPQTDVEIEASEETYEQWRQRTGGKMSPEAQKVFERNRQKRIQEKRNATRYQQQVLPMLENIRKGMYQVKGDETGWNEFQRGTRGYGAGGGY